MIRVDRHDAEAKSAQKHEAPMARESMRERERVHSATCLSANGSCFYSELARFFLLSLLFLASHQAWTFLFRTGILLS